MRAEQEINRRPLLNLPPGGIGLFGLRRARRTNQVAQLPLLRQQCRGIS